MFTAFVIVVAALAFLVILGWIGMCGFLGEQAAGMVMRLGQSDGDATHIPTEQELADEAQVQRIEQLLRETDDVLRETDEVLRQHRQVMLGGYTR